MISSGTSSTASATRWGRPPGSGFARRRASWPAVRPRAGCSNRSRGALRSGEMSYRVTASDGTARAGVLSTAHGEVPTPAFMPVGTKATVKSVDPDELLALGATVVLGNSYHLHFRTGADVIAELGGLHRFMAWDGPVLTDSGGFQVFSLRHTILGADDDGVTFRSVYDGEAARFTPESVP